jgi:hypothetical protein
MLYIYPYDDNSDNKIIKINLNNYKDINVNDKSKDIYLIKINNNISIDDFNEVLKNFNFNYTRNGIATGKNGKINYFEFINNINENSDKYIFHNLFLDPIALKKIKDLIPLPKNKLNHYIFETWLYAGPKYSGTHIHNHTYSLNYLLKGKKLWIILKNTNKNNNKIKENNLSWEKIRVEMNYIKPYDWIKENYNKIINEFECVKTLIQNENEVLIIPHKFYHFVLNLEPCIGITYGWLP